MQPFIESTCINNIHIKKASKYLFYGEWLYILLITLLIIQYKLIIHHLNDKISKYPGSKMRGKVYRNFFFFSFLNDTYHSEVNTIHFLLASGNTSTDSYWHFGNLL